MGKHDKEDKPGTDWEQKKRDAGKAAKEKKDRPYKPDPKDLTPIDESDIKWR